MFREKCQGCFSIAAADDVGASCCGCLMLRMMRALDAADDAADDAVERAAVERDF